MRLMRHRLSPRDTTLVKILGPVAGVLNPLSDVEPTAIAWADRKAAFSCSFAALKGGWGGAAAREAVSGTYSARDCVAPELAPMSFAPLRGPPVPIPPTGWRETGAR